MTVKVEITKDEISVLLYELDYRWGELMGGGDVEQANQLASIIDKIRVARLEA